MRLLSRQSKKGTDNMSFWKRLFHKTNRRLIATSEPSRKLEESKPPLSPFEQLITATAAALKPDGSGNYVASKADVGAALLKASQKNSTEPSDLQQAVSKVDPRSQKEGQFMSRQEIIQALINRAGSNRRILCGSMFEYIQQVAKTMYELNLDRRGSGRTETIDGRQYIIDEWILPDGTTIKSGYIG
jgi:hypothetical protein